MGTRSDRLRALSEAVKTAFSAGYAAGAVASVSGAAACLALPGRPDVRVAFHETAFVFAVLASGIFQWLGVCTFLLKIARSSEDMRSNAVKLGATNFPAAVSLIWAAGNATKPWVSARTTVLSLSHILIVILQVNCLAALAALVTTTRTQSGPRAAPQEAAA